MRGHSNKYWYGAAIGCTLLLAVTAMLVGFILLPYASTQDPFFAAWDAICSAAGLVRDKPVGTVAEHPDYSSSRVVLVPGMLRDTSAESIGRGATLSLQCTMCHGARGLSNANTPNLAGQFSAALYKQLQDYKGGARTNAIMGPHAAKLSEQDISDLAAFYNYLPRLAPHHPRDLRAAPRIVQSGAPMRNIPPCASCHGLVDYKVGSAWLEGQPEAYLRTQLAAFASGERHNDISAQMRNIARNMTTEEIEQAVSYYSDHLPEP